MKLQIIASNQTNPFLNVAVENYLLAQPEKDCVTMYLWKNRRTVVIGQNQNPYAECNVALLEGEGGYLMRRRTGGGAVYHDDGNLNFSFIATLNRYDQQRQFEVLKRAVAAYGLTTEVSGRNDVLCEGRKFSGNAFSKGKYQNLHHGTILIKGNMEDLQRYLLVKPAKLQKHGVASVKSRVVNLSELADVTDENLVSHLIAAFAEVYGRAYEVLDFDAVAQTEEVLRLRDEFASDAWRFGRWRSFKAQRSAQFYWGGVELALEVDEENAVIRDVMLSTDSLVPDFPQRVAQLLKGASTHVAPDTGGDEMLQDIVNLIYG